MSTPEPPPTSAGSLTSANSSADENVGAVGCGSTGEGGSVDSIRSTDRDRSNGETGSRQGDGSADEDGRDLVDIPAVEVISRAALLLMSAAAEQLGLASPDPDRPAHRDLDQARTLITALAGLVRAAAPDLGPHAAAFRDGLAGLQGAFREYSVHPDEPGKGPGE